jgi:hypothetical protein
MTKLNQIVALEKGEKDRTNKSTATLFQDATKPPLFAGLAKTYEPKDEGGQSYPPEATRVKITVTELLDAFVKPTKRLLDLISTKETANADAKADVVVDGVVILPDVPVTFLLQLEKYLTREVRGLVSSLQTLDSAFDWEPSTERAGQWQTDIVTRNKTTEQPKVITLAPPTDKHPAQVTLAKETVVEGYWKERKFSGAIPGARKQELIERVDKLIDAVKSAREKANDMEIVDVPVGDQIFAYLLS